MRALVTGVGGQLGRELLDTAPLGTEIRALDHETFDLTDSALISKALTDFKPNVVFNCAAYTAVDQAESDHDLAFAVNGDAVGHLARTANASGSRLVHVSTDFVFDGISRRPYRPSDPTGPTGVYGASKLEGERQALAASDDVVVVRSSWLYSRFGHNFVKTMLKLMRRQREIGVVADQKGSPTWARGLARALWGLADAAPDVAGILHWADLGVASWYDFAVAIRDDGLAAGLLEQPTDLKPLTSAEYPTPAKRPAFSALETDPVWKTCAPAPRAWREQLASMLTQLAEMGDA